MAVKTKERAVDDLPWMDVDDPQLAEDPAAFLARHRPGDWAYRSRRGVEIIRYEPVWRFLTDRRLAPDVADLRAASGLGEVNAFNGMLAANGAHHARLRGSAAAYFSPARVEQWRPFVQDACRRLMAGNGQTVDLIPALCAPLPGLVFTRMIGAPESDAARLCAWSDALLKIFYQDPANRDEILAADEALREYVLDQLAARRANPGDDLLSAMAARLDDDAELTGLAAELLSASTDNTTSQLGAALMHALADPAIWAALAEDPTMPATVAAEAERLTPRVGFINRKANTHVVIDDLAIPAGTWIRCSVLAGHHDESVFDNPTAFQPRRADQRRSLVFGAGPHYCIGAGLAQVEIEEALRHLATAYPGMHLIEEPVWQKSEVLAAVTSLPVALS
ncbi:cytochrome P450 [Actinoplanes sp. NPDC051851]|uniref:cytochrome P450 n=1 Tax=Actinoplanes sp. NPDC051851 TaxID=3154753 RepID=UPI003425C492